MATTCRPRLPNAGQSVMKDVVAAVAINDNARLEMNYYRNRLVACYGNFTVSDGLPPRRQFSSTTSRPIRAAQNMPDPFPGRSFRRRVFPLDHLHWNRQLNHNNQEKSEGENNNKTRICAAEMAVRYAALCACRKVHT